MDPTGHKTRTENPGYLDNVIDASTGDRVQGPSLAMDEEISVRAIPTPEDIQQLEANGQISRSEAIMRGVGANPVLQVPAEDPEFMKSSERLYWEAGAKSLASDATVPMQRMMNGAYTNNAGEFAIGAGETVVGAGGGVLLGKGLGAGAGALANRVPLLRRPLTASTRLNPETPLGGLGRSGAPKARVLKESTTTTDPTPEADPAVPAPKSKTKVVVRGTATYEVDEAGLTVSARGRISGPHRGRPKGRLPEPEGGRAPGEHRGHLIPEGGVDAPADVNVVENIISEAPGSNLGPKKSFDLRASKLARENSNATVETTHTPHRQTGSTRPDAVTHSIVVDGQTVHTVTIPNE